MCENAINILQLKNDVYRSKYDKEEVSQPSRTALYRRKIPADHTGQLLPY
jgi:hypothetical protein